MSAPNNPAANKPVVNKAIGFIDYSSGGKTPQTTHRDMHVPGQARWHSSEQPDSGAVSSQWHFMHGVSSPRFFTAFLHNKVNPAGFVTAWGWLPDVCYR